MKANYAYLILLLSLSLGGCTLVGPDVEKQVTFRADKTEYVQGTKLELTLINMSPWEIGYNLCGAPLEQYKDGQWGPAEYVPEDEVEGVIRRSCGRELRILRPGEKGFYTRTLRDVLPAERFRIRDSVSYDDSRDRFEIVTNSFRILAE